MCECKGFDFCSVCYERLAASPKPHKHAAVIKAWADGAKIQWLASVWQDVDNPKWDEDACYRVKPVPKPDRIEARRIVHYATGLVLYKEPPVDNNVQFTFDGETGKLKAVQLCE